MKWSTSSSQKALLYQKKRTMSASYERHCIGWNSHLVPGFTLLQRFSATSSLGKVSLIHASGFIIIQRANEHRLPSILMILLLWEKMRTKSLRSKSASVPDLKWKIWELQESFFAWKLSMDMTDPSKSTRTSTCNSFYSAMGWRNVTLLHTTWHSG